MANGTAMPTGPGCSHGSSEQGDAVDGDRHEAREGRVLVQRHQRARQPGAARDAAGHGQADADRERHERQRDDARRAPGQPPAVLQGVGRDHAALAAGAVRERPGELDVAVVVDQDAAVLGEQRARRPRGPRSSAALASVSASSAVGARAVTRHEPGPRRRAGQRGR